MPAFPALQGIQGTRWGRRTGNCVPGTHGSLPILSMSGVYCHLRGTEKEESTPWPRKPKKLHPLCFNKAASQMQQAQGNCILYSSLSSPFCSPTPEANAEAEMCVHPHQPTLAKGWTLSYRAPGTSLSQLLQRTPQGRRGMRIQEQSQGEIVGPGDGPGSVCIR